jgi:hypothetical protein
MVFIGLVLIFSYGMGNVSATSGNTIYVKGSGGNDLNDGSTWQYAKKTINNATETVKTNGTLNIANGQYNGTDNTQITINNNMTIKGESQKNTIINGTGTNWIFYVPSGITLNILNLTLTNGTKTSGGAIENDGTLTVTNSSFIGNIVGHGYGGAICNSGTLTVTDSNFLNNTSNHLAGAIANEDGTLTVTSSIFNSNTATYEGGAIYDYGGTLTVTGNTFTGNIATYGGAIYNAGIANVHFNRIIGNTATSDGNAIYNGGTVDAEFNWWGDNTSPAGKISGFNVNKWLVLTVTANPITIPDGGYSIITVDLTHDNTNTLQTSGYVPDGIPVSIITTLGNMGTPSPMVNGVSKATLGSGDFNGVAKVFATVDSQINTATVNIGTIAPTASASPIGGLYNTSKLVTLSMSEPGSIYYTTNGTTPTISSTKYTTPFTITKTTILKYLAVNLTGNKSPLYTQTYTIDKIPPKVTTTIPTNKKTNVSRISTIIIKFSENIKASTYFNKITIKNLTTHKTITLTKTIKGTTLSIKTTKRSATTWYLVTIPRAAIKDYAGNNLKANYTFKFQTGR